MLPKAIIDADLDDTFSAFAAESSSSLGLEIGAQLNEEFTEQPSVEAEAVSDSPVSFLNPPNGSTITVGTSSNFTMSDATRR
jgi:hypothetical protein